MKPRHPSRRTRSNTKKSDTTDPTPSNSTPDNDVANNTTENEKTQGIYVFLTAHLLLAITEFMMLSIFTIKIIFSDRYFA